jgi:hypothetical protein
VPAELGTRFLHISSSNRKKSKVLMGCWIIILRGIVPSTLGELNELSVSSGKF